jgi:hypothetical protein
MGRRIDSACEPADHGYAAHGQFPGKPPGGIPAVGAGGPGSHHRHTGFVRPQFAPYVQQGRKIIDRKQSCRVGRIRERQDGNPQGTSLLKVRLHLVPIPEILIRAAVLAPTKGNTSSLPVGAEKTRSGEPKDSRSRRKPTLPIDSTRCRASQYFNMAG